ncbi:MAG TPA: nuclear transport factor 2 family protein [Micromonosporaceae bacterium]|nr:nuclear transport factor 2 family protein [Micromonosporaceae bacterium]
MDDRNAIVATVKDYWEGWFAGDAERMERAVHPRLAKTGVVVDTSGPRITGSMTAEDMIRWTRLGEGVAEKPADTTFKITIVDVYHEIATVTVHSGIYREYLHLAKTPDGWKILNALYARTREDPTAREG